MGFRFRLVHRNGDDLGEREFATDMWNPGDTIPLGGGTLRVLEVEWEPEESEVLGTLTVEVA